MTRTTEKPLVVQELDAFYAGPLRDALRNSGIRYSYGDAGTGTEIDDMAFDADTRTALVEVLGDGATETGRVIGYGRGTEIVFHALHEFTAEYGTPATFVVELSDQPEPVVYRDGVAKILR